MARIRRVLGHGRRIPPGFHPKSAENYFYSTLAFHFSPFSPRDSKQNGGSCDRENSAIGVNLSRVRLRGNERNKKVTE